MYSNQRYVRQPIGFGAGGPPPRDILILLGVLLVTYSLHFFDTTAALVRLLHLTPDVWQQGYVWQLATYAFVAQPGGGFWFLISLLILFWFGRDVYRVLGRQHFWRLLAWGILTASVAAVAVQLVMWVGGFLPRMACVIMQGSTMLLINGDRRRLVVERPDRVAFPELAAPPLQLRVAL